TRGKQCKCPMFPEYKARESVKKLIFWFSILYVFKYIDKYIEVRYNMTIEVRYIALKGKHLWMRT
ncbi:hypothetical protein PZH33_23280, partial [Blautia schinkii]|uniref:hypothetical protein n=1 Tax=Blautia schinkii TaxID=180164 RepID=UPI0023AFEF0B